MLTILNLSLWLVLFLRLKKEFAPSVVLKEIRLEVEKLIIEINKEVDQDISLIEARRSGLKDLLEKVDEHIEFLQKNNNLLAKENIKIKEEQKILERLSPQKAYEKNKLNKETKAQALFLENQNQTQNQNQNQNVRETLFSSPIFDSQEINRSSAEKESHPSNEPIQISFSKNPIDPVQATKDLVLSLSRQGKTEKEIAESLQMSVREVIFILDLHSS